MELDEGLDVGFFDSGQQLATQNTMATPYSSCTATQGPSLKEFS